LPTLRGRQVSLRPDPAGPAGALAAVTPKQQHTSIPGPGGAPLERTGVPQPSQRPPR
jgi:hypothetical protein